MSLASTHCILRNVRTSRTSIYCCAVARFKFRAVSIRHPCHREAILVMAVCTPIHTLRYPPQLSYHAPEFLFWTITFVRCRFSTPAQKMLSFRVSKSRWPPLWICQCIFTKNCAQVPWCNSPTAVAVCVTRVGFVACFLAELQPRKYASLRFFHVDAVCSSNSGPSSPHDLHQWLFQSLYSIVKFDC